MRVIFDIETNGLLYGGDTIWCIVCKDLDGGEIYKYWGDRIEEGISLLLSAERVVGHHICGFDVPFIDKVCGKMIDIGKCFDTLAFSRMVLPEQASHSLEYYGSYFGREKPVHEDWSHFSKDMLHRCVEDVEINHMLYNWLERKEWKGWDWSDALNAEQLFAYDQALQEVEGVDIDADLAQKIVEEIDKEVLVIDRELKRGLPKRVVNNKMVNRPFLQNGEYSKMCKDWFNKEPT